jgi:diadenosine tetraphosphate (Ap4A) HIT family hydrolase
MGAVGWPEHWDDLYRGEGCPLCGRQSEATPFGLRVLAGRYADAILNRRAAQRGYVVVIWNGRHVAEPFQLTADEAAGYFTEVHAVGAAIKAHFGARKVNYETLGNAVPHLHTHVTARYADGDVNPGAPLPKDRDIELDEAQLAEDARALRQLLA